MNTHVWLASVLSMSFLIPAFAQTAPTVSPTAPATTTSVPTPPSMVDLAAISVARKVPAVCIPAIQADGGLDLMNDQLCPI